MEALAVFFGQFGAAYEQDMVPETATLPYMTYDVSRPSVTNASMMTIYNWHERKPDGNAKRADMLDRIAQAIPEGGVKITVGGGYVVIRRSVSDFQTLWQDSTNRDVIGGRTSCEVYFYVTGKEQ